MILIFLILPLLAIAYVLFNFQLTKRVALMGLPQDKVLPWAIKIYLTITIVLTVIVLVFSVVNIINLIRGLS